MTPRDLPEMAVAGEEPTGWDATALDVPRSSWAAGREYGHRQGFEEGRLDAEALARFQLVSLAIACLAFGFLLGWMVK